MVVGCTDSVTVGASGVIIDPPPPYPLPPHAARNTTTDARPIAAAAIHSTHLRARAMKTYALRLTVWRHRCRSRSNSHELAYEGLWVLRGTAASRFGCWRMRERRLQPIGY